LLILGGVLALGLFRRRRASAPAGLTREEEARVEALLARDD
jgi:cytochrome c-type biogenesis protein CcmH